MSEAVDRRKGVLHHEERRYRDGDAFALLRAAMIALADSPLPPHMLEAFTRAVEAYEYANAWTLDEAFDVSRPKGKHRQAAQVDKSGIAWKLRMHVENQRDIGVPIDQAILNTAKQFNFGKTKTEEIYYKHVKALPKWSLQYCKTVSFAEFYGIPVKNKKEREDS